MMMMKCSDCGSEFEEKKEKRQIKIEVSKNPGEISFESKAFECPNCKQHFIAEEDLADAFEAFEKECSRKQ